MAVRYERPAGATRLQVEPQLASWERAGHPSQVRLTGFLDHVAAVAAPVLAGHDGTIAVELVIGLPAGVPLTDGGRDLDNYLFPVAQRLGAERIAAMFGRKVHGQSMFAAAPAIAAAPAAAPRFTARSSGSYVRPEWKANLRGRLIRSGVQPAAPGPVTLDIAIATGPGRNWASLWKPLIDSLGPVLGEDPARPFHPRDDRITSLALHHATDAGLGHDVAIDMWWTAQ